MSSFDRAGLVRACRPALAGVVVAGALALASHVASVRAADSAGSANAQGAAALSDISSAMAGIGRAATPAEIKAWDIDVRPDFKGLPPGKGSVDAGLELWELKCASCHGVFGESNEVFTPLVGGTTKADIERGTVEALLKGGSRTTLMKVSTISTLWDYINRAMPWTEPKSLKPDEVYALVAYLLNLGGILPDEFELSNENIAEVQKLMPNRDGTTRLHGLWAADGKPDVKAVACMTNCIPGVAGAIAVSSQLPEHARDAHGNLADQQRALGPERGALTDRPAPASFDEMRKLAAAIVPLPGGAGVASAGAGTGDGGADSVGGAMLANFGCLACHGIDKKLVGPAFRDVYAKHKDRQDLEAYLAGKIKAGGQGVWGTIPMPPQSQVADADVQRIAGWLAAGAK